MRIPISYQGVSLEQERELAVSIEVGVLAQHLLDTAQCPGQATVPELQQLTEIGRVAFQRLLLGHLKLVAKLAVEEARRCAISSEDFFQEGCVSLAEALQRFDYRLGRFSTYATIRVRRRLVEVGASRLGELGVSVNRAMQIRRARGLATVLAQEQQREVTPGELAQLLGTTSEEASDLLFRRHLVPVADLGEELPEPEPDDPTSAVLLQQLEAAIAGLPANQARVLGMRFGLGGAQSLSQAEVGQRLGISPSTVRRVEQQTLRALRRKLDAELAPSNTVENLAWSA